MNEMIWDSDIFYAGKYEQWHKDITRQRIRDKIARILQEQFPPELVISREKADRLEEVMRSHIKDKDFVDRLNADVRKSLS